MPVGGVATQMRDVEHYNPAADHIVPFFQRRESERIEPFAGSATLR